MIGGIRSYHVDRFKFLRFQIIIDDDIETLRIAQITSIANGKLYKNGILVTIPTIIKIAEAIGTTIKIV